jgi:hypothetical protein
VNANGTLTWPTVESLFEKVFRYGSPNKLLIVSRRIATQLDLIAEGRLVTNTGETPTASRSVASSRPTGR